MIKVLLFVRNFAYSHRKIENHFLTSSPQCSLVNAHGGSLLEIINEVDFCRLSHANGPTTLENTVVTHRFKSLLSFKLLFFWLFSSPLYSLSMLMEALCWKLLTRSTFVCGSSHANGPTTLENTVTRSSSFRTRFRPFTPRQPSSNKVIRHCYTLL